MCIMCECHVIFAMRITITKPEPVCVTGAEGLNFEN